MPFWDRLKGAVNPFGSNSGGRNDKRLNAPWASDSTLRAVSPFIPIAGSYISAGLGKPKASGAGTNFPYGNVAAQGINYSRPKPRPVPPPIKTSSPFDAYPDALAALQQMAQGINDVNIDEGKLSAMAEAAVAAQYDPQIQALRNAMKQAEGTAGSHQKSLGELFGGLANSIEGDLPGIKAIYDAGEKETNSQYDQLKQEMEGTYKQGQKEQEDLFKRLNIQAAMPELAAGDRKDFEAIRALEGQESQNMRDTYNLMEKGALDWTKGTAQTSRLEGAERQADVMDQLRGVLAEYQNKIGETEANRGADFTKTLSSYFSSAQDEGRKANQQAFNNANTLFNKRFELDKYMSKPGPKPNYSGIRGVSQVLGESLDQNRATEAMSLIRTLMDASAVNYVAGTTRRETPVELISHIGDAARRKGFRPSEVTAISDAARAYFGKF